MEHLKTKSKWATQTPTEVSFADQTAIGVDRERSVLDLGIGSGVRDIYFLNRVKSTVLVKARHQRVERKVKNDFPKAKLVAFFPVNLRQVREDINGNKPGPLKL